MPRLFHLLIFLSACLGAIVIFVYFYSHPITQVVKNPSQTYISVSITPIPSTVSTKIKQIKQADGSVKIVLDNPQALNLEITLPGSVQYTFSQNEDPNELNLTLSTGTTVRIAVGAQTIIPECGGIINDKCNILEMYIGKVKLSEYQLIASPQNIIEYQYVRQNTPSIQIRTNDQQPLSKSDITVLNQILSSIVLLNPNLIPGSRSL